MKNRLSMLLRKIVLISFVVFSLNLPGLSTVKEVSLLANRNNTTNAETKLLAKKTDVYEFSAQASEQVSLENYISNSFDGFEEIVTKVDSGRVIVVYPTISTPVDSYQNYFETGHKIRRILQELLPLNIF